MSWRGMQMAVQWILQIKWAVRRCGLGALIAAAYQITSDHRRARDLAIAALRPLHGSTTLVKINDIRGHSAVLVLLDEVLSEK
jgi:hypothetical protein